MFDKNSAHSASTSIQKSCSKLVALTLGLPSLVAGGFVTTAIAASTVWNFETGDFTGWVRELCCSYSAVVGNTFPVRDGRYSVKFTLRKNDPDVSGSRRAELRHPPVPANSAYTYRFSIFLPTNYVYEQHSEIVNQWHSIPDKNLGEKYPSPPLYFRIQSGRWSLGRRWDPNQITVNNTPGPGGGMEMIDLGPYQVNVWTDWKVYVKWSYRSDGVLQVWKNGTLVKSINGPNTYNDAKGPYFKIGIYKPIWKTNPSRSSLNERVLYYDAVRMDTGRT